MWRQLRRPILHCGKYGARDTHSANRVITKNRSKRMAKPQVFKYDLSALKEPEDLWQKLFFLWLKSMNEEFDGSLQMQRSTRHAVAQLDKAISGLLPEKPEDLRIAIDAMQEAQEAWEKQSKRALENTERLAVIGKMIMAKQRGA